MLALEPPHVATLVVFSTESLFVLVEIEDWLQCAELAPLRPPRRLWRARWREIVSCVLDDGVAPDGVAAGAAAGARCRVTFRRRAASAADVADKLASVATSAINTAVGTRLDDEADVEIELEIPTAALRRTLCARLQRHGVTVHLARGGGVVADVLEVDEPLRRALC